MTWLMSALTVAVMWLVPTRPRLAWILALANTALWSWYIVTRQEWGLGPMNIALWIVYARNLVRTNRGIE